MATATLTTVVDRAIGDPITESIWDDQIRDNGNILQGMVSRNLLVNGGFEVWQRGAGGFTTNGVLTADMWKMVINTGSMTVTQETSVVDTPASASALKVVTSAAGDSIQQRIEDVVQLRGRQVSLSLRFRQSVTNASTLLVLRDNAGSSSAAAAATTGAYQTVTLTATVPSGATTLDFVMQLGAAGTYYLDNAMLVIGPAPAPYRPLHPQEELARCQRYYEVHGGASALLLVEGYGGAGVISGQWVQFAVPKGGTPTMTKNGTWAVTNCAQPSTAFPSANGYGIRTTVTALGAFNFSPNSADDFIVAEYNIP